MFVRKLSKAQLLKIKNNPHISLKNLGLVPPIINGRVLDHQVKLESFK